MGEGSVFCNATGVVSTLACDLLSCWCLGLLCALVVNRAGGFVSCCLS